MSVDRSRLPDVGPAPPFQFPAIARSHLANGLRVWCVEHHAVPTVTFLLLLPAGSASDPSHRPGLAALTADMADEGSGDRSAIEIHEALDRIGARFDTDVGPDSTTLALSTLSRFTSAGISLLAEMAIRPALRSEDFERVRKLRLNRFAQLRDLAPAVAERVFAQALYAAGPYGHLPLGTEASLLELELPEVAAFRRTVWRPPDATLIAVGDAPAEHLRKTVEAAFSSWEVDDGGSGTITSNTTTVEAPMAHAQRVLLVHRPGAAQSELRVGHVAVSRSTPDYHALLLLNMVLGGQFVSRINLKLREEKGYTYGARTAFEFRRLPGPFMLQVSVQSDATGDALSDIHGELQAIRSQRPPSDVELQLARAALTRGYPRNFETADQISRSAAQVALFDLPSDYFSRFVPTVEALQNDAVLHAAQTHLHSDRLTTVIVGDRDKVMPQLDGYRFGPIEEVSVN